MEFLTFMISYGVVSFICTLIWKNIIKEKNIFKFNVKLKKSTKEVIQFIICVSTIGLLLGLFRENILIVAILSASINSLCINILNDIS